MLAGSKEGWRNQVFVTCPVLRGSWLTKLSRLTLFFQRFPRVQQTNQRLCISHFNTHFTNDVNKSISFFSCFWRKYVYCVPSYGYRCWSTLYLSTLRDHFETVGAGISFYRESKPGIKIALQVMSLMVSLPFMLAARWCVVYHRPTTDERYLVYMHPLDFFLCS